MPELRSPTIRRRELGALLRSLRLERGLTVEQVAVRLLCSPSKVSRMETGHRGATARDVRDLCDLYGVNSPDERARMTKLAAEGKQQGWWQSYELDYFATFVGLEEAATAIKMYQSTTIQGLLQTPDYVRAMSGVLVPPLPLSVILDEAVLHRAVGGPVAMAAQLDRLIEAAATRDVTIQVIPYSAGAHAAMDSTFTIMEFAELVPTVVYVEGLMGWLFIERRHDVVRYLSVFDYLREIALNPQDSIELA